MVYKWVEYLKKRLLPSRCTLCLAADPSGLNLCRDCRVDLPWLDRSCPRCALPLTAPSSPCGHCQTHRSALDRTLALFQYAPPLAALIPQLKFGRALHHAPPFALLLAERVEGSALPDCLIPVPLHASRQRSRGFNQALEITRPLAKHLHCRLDHSSCRRTRATPAQSRLPAAQRRRHLRGAFALTRLVDARPVALVDDVMTTGGSLEALEEVLRDAGVETVEAWVCARTVPSNAR